MARMPNKLFIRKGKLIMENNEIMNDVIEVMVTDAPVEASSNGNVVVPMLIGSALTGAGIALFKLGKKAVANYKAKKAAEAEAPEETE